MDDSLLLSMPGAGTGPGPGLRGGQPASGFVQRIAQQGGGLFVRGAGGTWTACRLPPRRGSSPYLEVMASGEVRLWFNDGHGSYRVVRAPSADGGPAAQRPSAGPHAGRLATAMCAARSTLRQWSAGHSELVDHVLEVESEEADRAIRAPTASEQGSASADLQPS